MKAPLNFFNMITNFQRQVIETEINELQNSLSGDFMADMEIKDQIHQKEMKLNGVERASGDPEGCEFCSG